MTGTVWQDKPNLVRVVLSDETGEAERWVVGKSLDEAITMVDPNNRIVDRPVKTRKPRRTKAEMVAEKETVAAGGIWPAQ